MEPTQNTPVETPPVASEITPSPEAIVPPEPIKKKRSVMKIVFIVISVLFLLLFLLRWVLQKQFFHPRKLQLLQPPLRSRIFQIQLWVTTH